MKEIRNALKDLDIPDYVIEKITISGMRPRDCFSQKRIPRGGVRIFSPHMYFNTKFLETASAFKRKYLFLHEAGHIKLFRSASFINWFKMLVNEELSEVGADICALATLVRQTTKDNLQNLLESLLNYKKNYYSYDSQKLVYLTPQELVYYGKKLFNMMQQGEDKLDVLAYAQNIITARQGLRNMIKALIKIGRSVIQKAPILRCNKRLETVAKLLKKIVKRVLNLSNRPILKDLSKHLNYGDPLPIPVHPKYYPK